MTPDEIRKMRQEAFRQGWEAAKDEWFPVKELIRMWLKAESGLEGASEEDSLKWLADFHWDVFTVIAPYMKKDA